MLLHWQMLHVRAFWFRASCSSLEWEADSALRRSDPIEPRLCLLRFLFVPESAYLSNATI